jgi:hypothetical protein
MWDVWALVVGTFVRGSWIGQYQRIIHGNRVGLWGGPRFHAAISEESLYGDREIGRLQTASIGSNTKGYIASTGLDAPGIDGPH